MSSRARFEPAGQLKKVTAFKMNRKAPSKFFICRLKFYKGGGSFIFHFGLAPRAETILELSGDSGKCVYSFSNYAR
jgi:hypothetical protein